MRRAYLPEPTCGRELSCSIPDRYNIWRMISRQPGHQDVQALGCFPSNARTSLPCPVTPRKPPKRVGVWGTGRDASCTRGLAGVRRLRSPTRFADMWFHSHRESDRHICSIENQSHGIMFPGEADTGLIERILEPQQFEQRGSRCMSSLRVLICC